MKTIILIYTLIILLQASNTTNYWTSNFNSGVCKVTVKTGNVSQFISCFSYRINISLTQYRGCYRQCCDGMESSSFKVEDLGTTCTQHTTLNVTMIYLFVLVGIVMFCTFMTVCICCLSPSCRLYHGHNKCDCSCWPCAKNYYIQPPPPVQPQISILMNPGMHNSEANRHNMIYPSMEEVMIERQIQIQKQHECAICLQDNTNLRTSCGHYYHKQCLILWFVKNKFCPLCKNQKFLFFQIHCENCHKNPQRFQYIPFIRITCQSCTASNHQNQLRRITL